jgi:hypothetical protein
VSYCRPSFTISYYDLGVEEAAIKFRFWCEVRHNFCSVVLMHIIDIIAKVVDSKLLESARYRARTHTVEMGSTLPLQSSLATACLVCKFHHTRYSMMPLSSSSHRCHHHLLEQTVPLFYLHPSIAIFVIFGGSPVLPLLFLCGSKSSSRRSIKFDSQVLTMPSKTST